MEDNSRKSKRIAFRNTVTFGPKNPPEHISISTDISETGVYIKTNRIFPKGTNLFISVETPEGKYDAEGVVAWAKQAPARLMQIVKNGMGIKFTRVDEGLLDIIRKKRN